MIHKKLVAPVKWKGHTSAGAFDIIIVKHVDGDDASYQSTPWHVKFAPSQIKGYKNLKVQVTVNEVELKLGITLNEWGVANFVPSPEDLKEISSLFYKAHVKDITFSITTPSNGMSRVPANITKIHAW